MIAGKAADMILQDFKTSDETVDINKHLKDEL